MRVDPQKDPEKKAAEKQLKIDKVSRKVAIGISFLFLYYLFIKILFL